MFDKPVLWIAAALVALYYLGPSLWPTVRGWFVRPEPLPPPLPGETHVTADECFAALKTLRRHYAQRGMPEDEIAKLIEPHVPHLFR